MSSNPWAKALSPKKESSWRDIKFKIKTLRIAASRKGDGKGFANQANKNTPENDARKSIQPYASGFN